MVALLSWMHTRIARAVAADLATRLELCVRGAQLPSRRRVPNVRKVPTAATGLSSRSHARIVRLRRVAGCCPNCQADCGSRDRASPATGVRRHRQRRNVFRRIRGKPQFGRDVLAATRSLANGVLNYASTHGLAAVRLAEAAWPTAALPELKPSKARNALNETAPSRAIDVSGSLRILSIRASRRGV